MRKIINTQLEALMTDVVYEIEHLRDEVKSVDEVLQLRLGEARQILPGLLNTYEARLVEVAQRHEASFDEITQQYETRFSEIVQQYESRLGEIAVQIEETDIANQQARMAKAIVDVFDVQTKLIDSVFSNQNVCTTKINQAVDAAVALIKKTVDSPIYKEHREQRIYTWVVNVLCLAAGCLIGLSLHFFYKI